MRVLTLNLYSHHASWPERRKVLTDGLADLNPDLVAFQESFVEDDLLPPGYHYFHQSARENGVGCTIASRWPLGTPHELELPEAEPGEFAGWAGLVEVQGPEPLYFVNHKPSFRLADEWRRERQAVATARLVERVAGDAPVVLAGDFDAVPDSAALRFWRGLQSLDGMSVAYRDTWEWIRGAAPGHTFTPVNPLVVRGNWPLERGRRIDYVFVRCTGNGPSLRIKACRRVFTEPVGGIWASDHFGVVADLLPLSST
ncbi:endonuclease/exonuclease/phosphatase family protein [Nonomuraea sp. NPDC050310]|uniref:endonuclease/exonuclease/phosphatase family protein n=1 Tax=Nonomuraea sp. NPDC050310 TaxID=3154935 RepID=UPI0033E28D52